jgi:hypothetical protein
MNIFGKISTWRLFTVPDADRNWWEIILWWELRRIPYNLIVGLCGLLSLLLVGLISMASSFDLDLDSPLLQILFFGFAANLFYTGGWIAELLARRFWVERAQNLGPQLLLIGLAFSLMLDFSPVAILLVSWGLACDSPLTVQSSCACLSCRFKFVIPGRRKLQLRRRGLLAPQFGRGRRPQRSACWLSPGTFARSRVNLPA